MRPPAPALRGGRSLGLLLAAQLFISEEIGFDAALAAAVLVIVVAVSRPARWRPRIQARGRRPAGSRPQVAALLAASPAGSSSSARCPQHGSPFTPDFFKNDLSSFVVPSSLMLFHTAGSAAAGPRATRASCRSTSATWAGR